MGWFTHLLRRPANAPSAPAQPESLAHDNESWFLEVSIVVLEKMADVGEQNVRPLDRVIRWMSFTDYCMKNAGDLANGEAYPGYRDEAHRLAEALGLDRTAAAFALSESELESRYFTLFEGVVTEIRAAYENAA